MTNTNTKQFIDCKQHDIILSKLQAVENNESLSEPFQTLETYYQLLKSHDQAFPLLLSNGDQYLLERTPTQLYLLPEFKPLGPHKSWVLVQYPSVRDQLPSVEILVWDFPPGENVQISLLGKSHPIPDSPYIYEDFTQCALSIVWTIDSDALYITLQFNHGRLKINTDSNDGIESIHWKEHQPQHPNRRLERASFKDKPPLLWVKQNNKTDNWYRDNLYEQNQQPIRLPKDMGKIFGMDSAEDCPRRVYFGDNSSCINCIDLNDKDSRLLTSKTLGSGIYDVLIVPHPANEHNRTMLVATDNGHIFCLEDKGDQLNIRYYQATGEHFKQLLGFGGSDILAIDHNNNLMPLKLGNPDCFIDLQHRLTNVLFADSKINKCLKQPIAKFLKDGGNTMKAEHLLRLVTEHYFLHCYQQGYDASILNSWCHWLTQNMKPSGNNCWRWLNLHLSMLQRLEDGLKQACYKTYLLDGNKIAINDVNRLQLLWTMYCPDNETRKNIPDEVWLKILQGNDLIDAFLRVNDLNKKQEFQNKWMAVANQLAPTRHFFSQHHFSQRPLTILHGIRVNSPYIALQLVKETDDSFHNVAIDHRGDLYLLTVSMQGPSSCSPSLFPKPEFWLGRPLALLAGLQLQGLLGVEDKKNWVFVATDRGEMVLFEWTLSPQGDAQLQLRWKHSYPMFARNAIAITWNNILVKAIVLVGRDHTHHSSIARLYFLSKQNSDRIEANFKTVWRDEGNRGEIRKPVLSPMGDKLWAINHRRRSALLSWSILFKQDELTLSEQPSVILLSDQPLHCLTHLRDFNFYKLLIFSCR